MVGGAGSPQGSWLDLVKCEHLEVQHFVQKWEKEARRSSLRLVQFLLEEERSNLKVVNLKMTEQIEVTGVS